MSSSCFRVISARSRHVGVGLLHRSSGSSTILSHHVNHSTPNFYKHRHPLLLGSLSNRGWKCTEGLVSSLHISCGRLIQGTRGFCLLVENKVSSVDSGSRNDVNRNCEEKCSVDSEDTVNAKTVKSLYKKPVDFTEVDINMLPTVLIIGRPNVGKSALFNRLIRRREALVYNTPDDHVTRDIREGIAKLGDLRFKVLDSAGLETEATSGSILSRTTGMTAKVLARTQFAIFMIDVRSGLHPLDMEVGKWFRKHAPRVKPVIAMNKCESLQGGTGSLAETVVEVYKLGFGEPIAMSAETGLGMTELYEALRPSLEDYMAQVLNDSSTQDKCSSEDNGSCEVDESKLPLQLAIVGRPNVGKSTLLNTLLQEDRVLVGPEAGLTRDSVRVQFQFSGRTIYLVDTAGWLQRSDREKGPASLSIMQSRKNLMRAHVVALVLDAEEIANARRSMTHAEVVIARRAVEEGRGLVVIVNKMDLLKGKQNEKVMEAVPQEIQTVIPQVTDIPVVFISALEGRGRIAVMHQVTDTYEKWCSRLSTARLNRWLLKVMSRHSWKDQAAQPKIKYFTQVKARPPTFVAFVSGKTHLSDTDLRFLTRSLKEDFDLGGIPIRIMQRTVTRNYGGSSGKSFQNAFKNVGRTLSDKRRVIA
ncbi:MMR_HSR1 domain-containing protein [Cephalotus follicularis]|uniref:GTPase Der n=1 Tax=Cephalotus follicularis TaxID=3775 RepID=A0A1Q3CAU8_CEPFO|nr:MMR_HSR1 domain-containing protein [Cephalotus follicularis]